MLNDPASSPHAIDASLRQALQALHAADASVRMRARAGVLSTLADGAMPRPPSRSIGRRRVSWWTLPLAAAVGFALASLGVISPDDGTESVDDPSDTRAHEAPSVRDGGAGSDRAPSTAVAYWVAATTGGVELASHDQWRPLDPSRPLDAGARIRTPAGVKVAITIPGATGEIRLDERTEVALTDGGACEVVYGQIHVRIADTSVYSVSTADSTVATMSGDVLISCSAESGTTVRVLDGAARVRHRNGESVWLTPRQQVDVRADGLLHPRTFTGIAEATRWLLELLAQKGSDDPDFAHVLHGMLAELGEAKMKFLAEQEIRSLGSACALPLASFVRSERSADKLDARRRAAHLCADVAEEKHLGLLFALAEDDDGPVRLAAALGIVRVLGRAPAPGDPRESPGVWLTDAPGDREQRATWRQWWHDNRPEPPGADPH